MSEKTKSSSIVSIHTVVLFILGIYGVLATVFVAHYVSQVDRATSNIRALGLEREELNNKLLSSTEKYLELKNQDQYKINQKLSKDIENIHTQYSSLSAVFEDIQDLKARKQTTTKLEELYVTIVKDLSDLNYASGESKLSSLSGEIKKINADLAAKAAAAAAAKIASAPLGPAATSNTAPSGGFSYQSVNTEIGAYTVSIVAADMNTARVIIDTASDSDCRDNCPVLSLGDYAARSGAFAGINGSYFCPATYPSCAGKTNSYDTLLMNKNKHYFNSDNNVYSNVPVAVFGSGFARFIGQSSGWGRDTGVDGVIANQPLLLSGGNIAFGGGSDPKQGSKGARSFVGNKGSTVYIGVVYNATVAEVAYVLKALSLENALNLDSGGSTALWYGGYKAGPGRNIPNAILFVRK